MSNTHWDWRWKDPRRTGGTPLMMRYAVYVTRMRVRNGTDTKWATAENLLDRSVDLRTDIYPGDNAA